MINSATLLGSASGRNAGDAALMHAIMDSVDDACQRRLLYDIPTLNPEFVWQNYTNRVRPVGILPWNLSLKLLGLPTYKSLMRTDLSLIFDATLFDRELYNPYFNFLSSFAALLPAAKKQGKKMACFTVTVGPCRTPKGKDVLKKVMELMDFITVRDEASIAELNDAKVDNPNVLITNDAALLTKPSSKQRVQQVMQEVGLDNSSEIMAINVNPYFDSWAGLNKKKLTKEEFVNTYSAALTKALEGVDAQILFIATQYLDETLTKEIMEKTRVPNKKVYLSNKVYSHHDIRGVMENVAMLFAMRLHCLILTSAGHTPVISLNYLPKVTTYLKSLGLADYSLGFENFNEKALTDHIRKGWENRSKIRAILDDRVPKMKFEVYKAAVLVDSLSKGLNMTEEIKRLKGITPENSRSVANS